MLLKKQVDTGRIIYLILFTRGLNEFRAFQMIILQYIHLNALRD